MNLDVNCIVQKRCRVGVDYRSQIMRDLDIKKKKRNQGQSLLSKGVEDVRVGCEFVLGTSRRLFKKNRY
jgi:hypothetical protein